MLASQHQPTNTFQAADFPRNEGVLHHQHLVQDSDKDGVAGLVLDTNDAHFTLDDSERQHDDLHDGSGEIPNGGLPPISEELGKMMHREVAPQMFPGMAPILAPMYSHLPYNPSALEDAPLYVNAKQYNRILKRRQARAKLESSFVVVPRKEKPYIHTSRHNWAVERKRGPGGRFLSKDEMRGQDDGSDDKKSGDIKQEHSSEEGSGGSGVETDEVEQHKRRRLV